MSKSYKTTREKLYNEIWQMTVTHYCHKYNVSYKELKKCCEENDIPMPTALYWRKLKGGGNPKILPLPPSDIIDIEIPCIQTQRKYFDLTSKANTVCVLKILEKYSDEKKPLSVRKIIELMERDYMLSVSRATVYDSLEILNKLGYDISTYSENSKGYYLRYRKFNTYEIQTIIDSVAINPMVPTKIEKEIQFKIKKEMGYPNYKSYREIHGVDKRNKMYHRFYYNI
ncbi:MAG: helix-turn-helix domain-containing protein [Clostridia bacterium]|nr:helix-turn-helix domain-containing protein [Clostridia bacterium]